MSARQERTAHTIRSMCVCVCVACHTFALHVEIQRIIIIRTGIVFAVGCSKLMNFISSDF